MKFTKEEISLCKQVAEKHRKDIEHGDWMIIEGDPHEVPALYIGQDFPVTKRTMLPLWTISDCLEFLREKGGFIVNAHDDIGDSFSIEIETANGHWKGTRWLKTRKKFIGKGLLEVCLKAVLAVLEEESK